MAASVALACVLLASGTGHARTLKEKKQAAAKQFETAERMKEALEGKSESRRTRRDFQQVIDSYRKVYYTAPNSNRADASALAVAELLEEQGRILNEPKSFKDAIGQLEFLRREYPGSKYRVEALFTIAQIYRDDLDDSTQARATYEDFLKHYPQSTSAAKARAALAQMDEEAKGGSHKAQLSKGDVVAGAKSPSKNAALETKPVNPQKDASLEPVREVAAETARTEHHGLPLLTKVRHWSTPDYTRVAIDLEEEVKYEAGRVPNPDRIFFDLHGVKLSPEMVGKTLDVEDGFLHKIRVAQFKPNLARVVLDVDDVAEYSAFLLPNPYRLIIDIHGKHRPAQNNTAKGQSSTKPDSNTTAANTSSPVTQPLKPVEPPVTSVRASTEESKPEIKAPAKTDAKPDSRTEVAKNDSAKSDAAKVEDASIAEADKATPKPTTGPTFKTVAPHDSQPRKTPEADTRTSASSTRTAAPTASGSRSLIRALGLKIGRIVIDAGHGGHDTGTIGPTGLREKDLVLDVALKLGKLLEDRLGAEVVYTRDDDTFIPLETRTAIANKEQADLFISIHANSSRDGSARGVETYYLNFTSSADALEVAARENSVSEKSIHELQDLVKKIALKEKIQESREFAADVQKSLYTGLNAKAPGLRNRGVKKAPFIVLIGANMPSILAEISFVSNSADEKRLKTSDYRQRVAESLYKGIAKYASGLSGIKVATKPESPQRSESVSMATK
jgi:N-acetylmuramoyl-L-alanine amidase